MSEFQKVLSALTTLTELVRKNAEAIQAQLPPKIDPNLPNVKRKPPKPGDTDLPPASQKLDQVPSSKEMTEIFKTAGDAFGTAALMAMMGIKPRTDLSPSGIKEMMKGATAQVKTQVMGLDKALDQASEKQMEMMRITNQIAGDFDTFASSLKDSTADLSKMGITMTDVADAQVKLAEGSTGYNKILQDMGPRGKKYAAGIAAWVAQLDKAGTPIETMIKGTEFATQTLGFLNDKTKLTNKGMNGFFNSMLKSAQESITPYKKIIESATGSMKDLSLLGLESMTYNMRELNKATAATGITQEKFLGMAGKYETLEGASAQVGQLHAVLRGTSLGVGELMTAEPVNRVKKVMGDINLAMKEGRFKLAKGGPMRLAQIKALAQAAGIEASAMQKLLVKEMKVEEVFKKRGKAPLKTTGDLIKRFKPSAPIMREAPQKEFENKVLTSGKTVGDYTTTISKSSEEIAGGMGKLGNAIGDFAGRLVALNSALTKMVPEGADKDKGGLYTQLLFGDVKHFETLLGEIKKLTKNLATTKKKVQGQVMGLAEKERDRLKKLADDAKKKKDAEAKGAGDQGSVGDQNWVVDPQGIAVTMHIPTKAINQALTQA